MTEISPLLALPYLMPAQAQKHVTHNAALQILDALVQLRLVALDATTPPETPAPGAAYALGATPADAWAGQGGQLAIWQDPQWLFLTPRAGWRAWVARRYSSRSSASVLTAPWRMPSSSVWNSWAAWNSRASAPAAAAPVNIEATPPATPARRMARPSLRAATSAR